MNTTMSSNRLGVLVSALALLGGCVAVPVDPGYYTDSSGYYGPAPVYVAPPPVYYGAPAVFFGSRVYVRPHAGGGSHGGKRGAGSGRGSGRGRR